jgi:hypothetical protein
VTAAATEVAVAKSAVAVKGQCDKPTALNLTREIKRSVEQSWTLLKEAFERRAWAALGYDSWQSYCSKELGTGLVRLSTELRRDAVAELTSGKTPMSNRAIAAALGVSEGTVRSDLTAGAQNYAPNPPAAEGIDGDDPEVIDADVIDDRPEQPPKVSGIDGKTYTVPPRDVPAPRRRRPLPEAFRNSVHNLEKVVDRLTRLTQDDRFPDHAGRLYEFSHRDLERIEQKLGSIRDALRDAGMQPEVNAALAAAMGDEDG